MNKKNIFSVGVKLLSLLLFLNFYQSIFQFLLVSTSPQANSFTLFSVSPIGVPVLAMQILFYGITGFIFFTKSDEIANKFIVGNDEKIASRETVLQLVVAYQAIAGIVSAAAALLSSFFYLLPLLAVGAMQDGQGGILAVAGIPLVWLAVSIWMLRSYEKIAAYLLQKIPQKFWPK